MNAFNPGLLIDTNFHVNSNRCFEEEFLKKISDRMGSSPESGKALSDMITKSYYREHIGKYNDWEMKYYLLSFPIMLKMQINYGKVV